MIQTVSDVREDREDDSVEERPLPGLQHVQRRGEVVSVNPAKPVRSILCVLSR